MTPSERIQEMFRLAGSETQLFPATIFYNEGWLLRLVLDWFSRQTDDKHVLSFKPNARWFSEALLPSQFLRRSGGDHLGEGYTHADGIVGHVKIGTSEGAVARTELTPEATQFLVTEAKLFSRLSSGVTNARDFDQAARNVACIAQVLYEAKRQPHEFSSLGFFVLAPAQQINAGIFRGELSTDSIEKKVRRRVEQYSSVEKKQWLEGWFLPALKCMKIEALSWEDILKHIQSCPPNDGKFATELSKFYTQCLKFNRLQEQE